MKTLYLFTFCWFCYITGFAQQIDPTFSVRLEQFTSGHAIELLANGHMLVAGQLTSVGDTPTRILVKLKPDGSPDPSFRIDPSIINGQVSRISSGSDGRIVVQGSFLFNDASTLEGILALKPTGDRDPTFTPISAPIDQSFRYTQLSNGNLFTASSRFENNRSTHFLNLHRPDGSIHPDFVPVTLTTSSYLWVKHCCPCRSEQKDKNQSMHPADR